MAGVTKTGVTYALYGKRIQVAEIAYEAKKFLYDAETITMNGRHSE